MTDKSQQSIATANKIVAVASSLGSIAAAFDPKDAAIINGLLIAGAEVNKLLHEIMSQTQATEAAVWNDVRTSYADAVAAFEASRVVPVPATVQVVAPITVAEVHHDDAAQFVR